MAIYLTDFEFLSRIQEEKKLINDHRTYINSVYPYGIFPRRGLSRMAFDHLTILYGGNGSGKSTALNIIAAKLALVRDVPFRPTVLFDEYVVDTNFNSDRYIDSKGIPDGSRILCSEDVFDRTLAIRATNHDINRRREDVEQEWRDVNYHGGGQRRLTTIHGAEFEAYKRTDAILRNSMSSMITSEVGLTIPSGSNGENSFRFFLEKIRAGALYLLDEPEDSLSAKWQVKLAELLEGMARFEKCQFVIATHSPFLLGIQGAKIYDLDSPGTPVRKWTELENVREYRDFFRAREDEFG